VNIKVGQSALSKAEFSSDARKACATLVADAADRHKDREATVSLRGRRGDQKLSSQARFWQSPIDIPPDVQEFSDRLA
jgi:hypothetical protein